MYHEKATLHEMCYTLRKIEELEGRKAREVLLHLARDLISLHIVHLSTLEHVGHTVHLFAFMLHIRAAVSAVPQHVTTR